MKTLKMVLSALLIISGSFLEVLYVFYRYKADGISMLVCLIIGASLNIFLMLAVYEKKTALVIALICFSILNTTSGQTLSILRKESAEKTEIAVDETGEQIKRYKSDIAKLDKEIDVINNRLSGFASMEAKAEYKNNVREDEASVKEKRAEKLRLEEAIKTAASERKESVEETIQATSIYTFYGSMRSWKEKDWLTFALHTVLSFFISIMAPFGIHTLEKTAKKPELDLSQTREFTLEDWVTWVWRGCRIKRKIAPSLYAMQEYAYIASKRWDKAKHTALYEKAVGKGLIGENGALLAEPAKALKIMRGE